MTRRFFAVILCFAMFFAVGCAEKPTLLEFIDPNPVEGVVNLDGQVFNCSLPWNYQYYIPEDYTSVHSQILELKNERWLEAEKNFNVKFEFDGESPIVRISAGYGAHELIDNNMSVLYDYYKSGILAALDDISTINLDDDTWGNKNFIKYGRFGGKQYGFFPWNWNEPEVRGAMMFNGELIKTNGATVPYEYKESGTWNWETFKKELEIFPSSIGEIELIPLRANGLEHLGFAALHSNGLSALMGDDESGYTFGFNNAQSYETFSWLNSLHEEGLIGSGTMEGFTVTGNCVYYISESYHGTGHDSDSTEKYAPLVMTDYGFITFPTGPKGSETDVGSYTSDGRRLLATSDKADMEIEDIGTVLSYVFAPLEGYESAAWKDYMGLVLQSEESLNNWISLIENANYDYSAQIPAAALISSIQQVITGARSASEAMSEIAPTMNEKAREFSMNE